MASDWCERHKDYHHIKEVARDIMKNNSITRADLKSFLDTKDKHRFFEFQQLIFEKQNSIEVTLTQKKCSFITDRGPDPLVFVEQHINHESAMRLADSHAAKMCLQRYRSKSCVVVIVCPLDKIEDDSIRMVPTHKEQLEYTECLKCILQELKIPYQYCDKTDRVERLEWLENIVLSLSKLSSFV